MVKFISKNPGPCLLFVVSYHYSTVKVRLVKRAVSYHSANRPSRVKIETADAFCNLPRRHRQNQTDQVL